MTKMKKQSLTILILCVVLVGLGVAYFFAGKYQKSKETTETEEAKSTVLYKLKEDEITKLRYSNDKADLTLVKDGDTWKIENNADFPVDQTKVSTMLTDVASITASQIITQDCTDLSEYELNEPQLSLEITDKNGTTKKISYGLESVAAEGCYAYTDDTKKIYVVPSNVTSDFDYSKNQMMEVPDAPDITAEYVTSYSVDRKKGDSFAAKYDKDSSKYKNIYGWDITKPYKQTVAGDKDGLETLFSSATSLEYTEGVTYKATERELKQYGLKNPNYTLSMRYYTVSSDSTDSSDTTTEIAEKDKKYHDFKLLVGNLDDTQENYYVKADNDAGIYIVAADTIKSMVEVDAFSCAYKTPCPANTDSLKSIALTYNKKTYSMTLSKEEKPSTSSSTEYNYTAKIDGKKVDDEVFRTAYEAFGNLSYSAQIKSSVKPASDEAIATISFVEDNKKATVSFLPYDGDNFYRVEVDGVCQFVTDKSAVDTCLKNLAACAK